MGVLAFIRSPRRSLRMVDATEAQVPGGTVTMWWPITAHRPDARRLLLPALASALLCSCGTALLSFLDRLGNARLLPVSGLLRGFLGVLVLAALLAAVVGVWVLAWRRGWLRPWPSRWARSLHRFIVSNALYRAETVSDGAGRSAEVITASMVLSAYVSPDGRTLHVRAHKDGSVYQSECSNLADRLSAWLGLEVENVRDGLTTVEYVFQLVPDARLEVCEGMPLRVGSTEIPLTRNLSWGFATRQPHALISGATGGGKTTFINYLILSFLSMGADVYVCDPKAAELSRLGTILDEPGCRHVGTTPGQIAGILRHVCEVMQGRYEAMEAGDVRYGINWADFIGTPREMRPCVVFLDEMGGLRAEADKKTLGEIQEYLAQIVLKGRAACCVAVISSQQMNASNLSTEIRDQLGMRVSLGALSRIGMEMTFGSVDHSSVRSIDGVGQGYVYLDGLGWESVRPFSAPLVDFARLDFMAEARRLHEATRAAQVTASSDGRDA